MSSRNTGKGTLELQLLTLAEDLSVRLPTRGLALRRRACRHEETTQIRTRARVMLEALERQALDRRPRTVELMFLR
jgi:hypothetical protein